MQSEDLMRRLRLISRTLVASALLVWAYFYYLSNHYDDTRPTVADEVSGRVFPLNSHGHVVYLTMTEEYLIRFLVLAAVGCFISGFVIDRRFRRLSDDSDRISESDRGHNRSSSGEKKGPSE
jgi:hypothetical protein